MISDEQCGPCTRDILQTHKVQTCTTAHNPAEHTRDQQEAERPDWLIAEVDQVINISDWIDIIGSEPES